MVKLVPSNQYQIARAVPKCDLVTGASVEGGGLSVPRHSASRLCRAPAQASTCRSRAACGTISLLSTSRCPASPPCRATLTSARTHARARAHERGIRRAIEPLRSHRVWQRWSLHPVTASAWSAARGRSCASGTPWPLSGGGDLWRAGKDRTGWYDACAVCCVWAHAAGMQVWLRLEGHVGGPVPQRACPGVPQSRNKTPAFFSFLDAPCTTWRW